MKPLRALGEESAGSYPESTVSLGEVMGALLHLYRDVHERGLGPRSFPCWD